MCGTSRFHISLLTPHLSLLTYHFSLITSEALRFALECDGPLPHATRRSHCRQRSRQNRYNHLYHRLPSLLFHSLNFQIINFKFQTSIFKL